MINDEAKLIDLILNVNNGEDSIISGKVRMYFGENLETIVDAEAGDFIYVAPNTVHIEENLSETEPVEFIVSRNATSSLVVNVDG